MNLLASIDSRAAIEPCVFGLLLVALGTWAWSTVLADFSGDNAVYWLTANHFSPWGAAAPHAAHFAAKSVFPPLYPLVLALSGGGTSLLAAHVVSAVLLWLGLLIFARLLGLMGISTAPALGLVVAVAASRSVLREVLQLHSEHLYLLLSLLALVFALSAASHRKAIYLCAGCVAAAYLTRTSGIALALAMVAFTAMRHRSALPGCLFIIGLPIVAWSLWHHGSASYVSAMMRPYEQAGIADLIARNLEILGSAWLACFNEAGLVGYGPMLPTLFALCGLGGLLVRLDTAQPDALYVPLYLAMLVLWPYPAEYQRMLYPIFPLILAQGMFFVASWLPDHLRGLRPRYSNVLFLALLAAAMLPYAAHALTRFLDTPLDAKYAPYTRTLAWYMADPTQAVLNVGYQRAITEALLDVRVANRVEPDACLLATKTAVVSLYTHRFTLGLPRPGRAGTIDIDRLRRNPCRALFMTQATSPSFPYAYFPFEQTRELLTAVRVYPNPVRPDLPAALLGHLPDNP